MPSSPTPAVESPLRDRVREVIDLIRPAVQADGGDIELVDVDPAVGEDSFLAVDRADRRIGGDDVLEALLESGGLRHASRSTQ